MARNLANIQSQINSICETIFSMKGVINLSEQRLRNELYLFNLLSKEVAWQLYEYEKNFDEELDEFFSYELEDVKNDLEEILAFFDYMEITDSEGDEDVMDDFSYLYKSHIAEKAKKRNRRRSMIYAKEESVRRTPLRKKSSLVVGTRKDLLNVAKSERRGFIKRNFKTSPYGRKYAEISANERGNKKDKLVKIKTTSAMLDYINFATAF